MKEWHFFDKVYRTYVVVVHGTSEEFETFLRDELEYTEDLESLNLPQSTGYLIDMNSENNKRGSTCLVLWVKTTDLPLLVHELAHLCDFVFDDKGIPMRKENTEAYAYYLEHWFIEVTETWDKWPYGRSADQLSGKSKKRSTKQSSKHVVNKKEIGSEAHHG